MNRSPSLTITSPSCTTTLTPLPDFSALFKPKSLVNEPSSMEIDAAAKSLSTILSAAAGSLTPQMMLSTLGRSLDAQVPPSSMRRSTPNLPNLLGAGQDHPSAFKPLKPPSADNANNAQSSMLNTNTNQESIQLAMNQLFKSVQSNSTSAQSQSTSIPGFSLTSGFGLSSNNNTSGSSGGRLSPSILRQNSIGGLGFTESNTNTNAKAPTSSASSLGVHS